MTRQHWNHPALTSQNKMLKLLHGNVEESMDDLQIQWFWSLAEYLSLHVINNI